MTAPLHRGRITCPICSQPAEVRSGRVASHSNVIRGWADDKAGVRVMADITVTCAPRIRVVRPKYYSAYRVTGRRRWCVRPRAEHLVVAGATP